MRCVRELEKRMEGLESVDVLRARLAARVVGIHSAERQAQVQPLPFVLLPSTDLYKTCFFG